MLNIEDNTQQWQYIINYTIIIIKYKNPELQFA